MSLFPATYGQRIEGLARDGKPLQAAVFDENQLRAAAGMTLVAGSVAFVTRDTTLRHVLSIAVGFSLALLGAGCGGAGDDDPQTEAAMLVAAASDGSLDARRDDGVPVASFTPITMRVLDRVIPVKRSDGRWHVLYELELTNRKADPATIQRLDVLDANGGTVLAVFDAAQVADQLEVRDRGAAPGGIGPGQAGVFYVTIAFDRRDDIPRAVEHSLFGAVGADRIAQKAARVALARPSDLVFDPPLRGKRYIAGDSCCNSTPHIRASLPFNGSLYTSQRFAIDWEQLDEHDRIYATDPRCPRSDLQVLIRPRNSIPPGLRPGLT